MIRPPPRSTLFPYTDALPILASAFSFLRGASRPEELAATAAVLGLSAIGLADHNTVAGDGVDRKSTRLNSSHVSISYAVFCLKKKNKQILRRVSDGYYDMIIY